MNNEHQLFPFCCKDCGVYINNLFLVFNKKRKEKNSLEVIQDDFESYKELVKSNLELILDKERELILSLNPEIGEESENRFSLIALLIFIYYVKLVFGNKEYLNRENKIIRFLRSNTIELNIQSSTIGAEKALEIIISINEDIEDFLHINYE